MIRYKKLPDNILQKIDSLTGFLKKDPNIIFAYLFGGLLKKRRNPLSDIDIAVYLKDTGKSGYLELFGKISDLLNTDEVDLVILNTAPISLAGRVLQDRRVLIDK
ncbi:MAG: nucleotidyltransferase domain-containing protein, partial [Nitrospirae bacterium]|nr:nucleotidyltransferase domain-containing protein [Nitrospirota bacterium]